MRLKVKRGIRMIPDTAFFQAGHDLGGRAAGRAG